MSIKRDANKKYTKRITKLLRISSRNRHSTVKIKLCSNGIFFIIKRKKRYTYRKIIQNRKNIGKLNGLLQKNKNDYY